MNTKAGIFNLALGALLLQRQVTNADTDDSTEARVLRTHWDVAWTQTLVELDMNATQSRRTLAIHTSDPSPIWLFAYTRPSDCAFIRRVVDPTMTYFKDNENTFNDRQTGILEGANVIYSNVTEAVLEYIPNNVPYSALNPNAVLAVAYKLAWLSAPLIVGKGAKGLKESIAADYGLARLNAMAQDAYENREVSRPEYDSSFVAARVE